MRIASGKVVDGHVEYEGELPDGSEVTLLAYEPEDTFEASEDVPDQSFTNGNQNPRNFNWGFTIQYSLPYLKSAVIDLGLPDFLNRFIPLVEATLRTPVAHTLHQVP